MRIAMFYHSLVSDWNHGNAHFLRGVVAELLARGHHVQVFEPRNNWSLENLVRQHGTAPLDQFAFRFPSLQSTFYDLETLDLDAALDATDLVIVHEWNEPRLIASLGRHRAAGAGYRLLLHDTHHRALTEPSRLADCRLGDYDGVLAYGRVLRDLYLENGWTARAWVWHEAADTRIFRPKIADAEGEIVWIGNWGDEERTAEIHEYLLAPVRTLRLRCRVFGVRYPRRALAALRTAGVEYAGWLPNWQVPEVFARHRVTIHIPRRAYRDQLPGIPTIRVFEALACGIPLICARWDDAEGLFTPGRDYLVTSSGREMRDALAQILADAELAASLACHGRQTVQQRHTCRHRVDELLDICAELGVDGTSAGRPDPRYRGVLP